MILLSIDPATHGCGAALFQDGVLLSAAYIPNKAKDGDIVRRCALAAQAVVDWLDTAPFPACGLVFTEKCELVVELPQVYTRGAGKTKGDPNKVCLPLAMVDASLAALLPNATVYNYQPHVWKGGTSKPERVTDGEYVILNKVKSRLSSAELQAIDWSKSVAHSWDVADSIGVALHHLGRFERVRMFARE